MVRVMVSLGFTAGFLSAMYLVLSTAPVGVVPMAGIEEGGVPQERVRASGVVLSSTVGIVTGVLGAAAREGARSAYSMLFVCSM